jgi:hypothetical protein
MVRQADHDAIGTIAGSQGGREVRSLGLNRAGTQFELAGDAVERAVESNCAIAERLLPQLLLLDLVGLVRTAKRKVRRSSGCGRLALTKTKPRNCSAIGRPRLAKISAARDKQRAAEQHRFALPQRGQGFYFGVAGTS